MHPELKALLHTARYALDDDMPRLVVADWLEEHGDESERHRAEYIRASVQVARLRPWDEAWESWQTERRELERAHMAGWTRHLREIPGVGSIQHDRGLFCPHLSPEALPHLEQLLTGPESAWIEGIRCWGWPEAAFEQLLRSPLCEHLASLGLGDCQDQDLDALRRFPYVRRVRNLLLINANQNSQTWTRRLTAGTISSLMHLCLLGNQIDAEGIAPMRDHGCIEGLITLDLSQNPLGVEGAQALATLSIPRLAQLDLSWCNIGGPGLAALADSPIMDRLEEVRLSSNDITLEGIEALAASARTTRLLSLDLGFNQIGIDEVNALARSRLMTQLRRLDMRYNQITDDAADVLIDSPLRRQVARLDLTGNEAITAGMKKRLKRAFGEALLS